MTSGAGHPGLGMPGAFLEKHRDAVPDEVQHILNRIKAPAGCLTTGCDARFTKYDPRHKTFTCSADHMHTMEAVRLRIR